MDSGAVIFCLLREYANDPPPVLVRPIRDHYDAAWVRARIPHVFGFQPELSDIEKTLLNVGFVAVPEGAEDGFPFVCVDYYGQTGIMFSPEGPDEATKARIAGALWACLLQEPEELSNFEAKVYHPGAGVWMNFACCNGDIRCDESQDDD